MLMTVTSLSSHASPTQWNRTDFVLELAAPNPTRMAREGTTVATVSAVASAAALPEEVREGRRTDRLSEIG